MLVKTTSQCSIMAKTRVVITGKQWDEMAKIGGVMIVCLSRTWNILFWRVVVVTIVSALSSP